MKQLITTHSFFLKEYGRRIRIGPLFLPVYKAELLWMVCFSVLMYICSQNETFSTKVPFFIRGVLIPIITPIILCRIEYQALPLWMAMYVSIRFIVGPKTQIPGLGSSQWSRLSIGPLAKAKWLDKLIKREWIKLEENIKKRWRNLERNTQSPNKKATVNFKIPDAA